MKAAILGAGNIGLALAHGLVEAGAAEASEITLTRRNASQLESLAGQGFRTTTSNKNALDGAEVVFLCILPQQLNQVLEEIAPVLDAKKQLVISVVTGAHTDDIREHLGNELRVIRAMP
ncbi:MAG: pyrroline-5-carboxylate reductase, partial [Sphingobacteriales bacterium]